MIHPGPRGTFHLLLVEDNPADIRLLREALQVFHLPCEFQVVTDGEAALLFLRQQPPPILSTCTPDANMPKKTGHEVLQEVKQDRALSAYSGDCPVVFRQCLRCEPCL